MGVHIPHEDPLRNRVASFFASRYQVGLPEPHLGTTLVQLDRSMLAEPELVLEAMYADDPGATDMLLADAQAAGQRMASLWFRDRDKAGVRFSYGNRFSAALVSKRGSYQMNGERYRYSAYSLDRRLAAMYADILLSQPVSFDDLYEDHHYVECHVVETTAWGTEGQSYCAPINPLEHNGGATDAGFVYLMQLMGVEPEQRAKWNFGGLHRAPYRVREYLELAQQEGIEDMAAFVSAIHTYAHQHDWYVSERDRDRAAWRGHSFTDIGQNRYPDIALVKRQIKMIRRVTDLPVSADTVNAVNAFRARDWSDAAITRFLKADIDPARATKIERAGVTDSRTIVQVARGDVPLEWALARARRN